MKNSHLLIASPALSSMNRNMTEILNQDMNRLLNRGRRLRSEAAYRGIRRVADWLRRGVKALRHAQQRRASIHDLSALDDSTLRDIGLSRADIRDTVDGLFRLSRHDTETDTPALRELEHTIGAVAEAGAAASNDCTVAKVAQA